MSNEIDPYVMQAFIQATDWLSLEDWQEMKLGKVIYQKLQEAYNYCQERPRYVHWWDQVIRSSNSIVLNLAETAKGRGYYLSCCLIARGEAYETAASISIGPPDICNELKPLIKELILSLNNRILAVPEAPATQKTTFQKWGRSY